MTAPMNIIIVGAGIAGLASAIALSKMMAVVPKITIIELRPSPSRLGGAIGLMPNALRCLHHLGVLKIIEDADSGASINQIELFDAYTAGSLGQIRFTGPSGNGMGQPPFKALRIMRCDLQKAMLEVVEALDNVSIEYGLKMVKIEEDDQQVGLSFEQGPPKHADLLIGCDGIHSKVRQLLIEPDRKAEYTGIAAVSGFADLQVENRHWEHTGLVQGQRGSFLSSLYTKDPKQHYLGAIMETKGVESREGWLAKGAEQESIKQDVSNRYKTGAMPYLQKLIESSHGWNLYPVYKLGPAGSWTSKRAILLGDAAHAMPPQGESAAIALEDAIVFGRAMSIADDRRLVGRFAAYQRIRRPRIDEAYQHATFGWNTNKDCSWVQHKLRGWLTMVFLWWTRDSQNKRYGEDLFTAELDLS